MINILSTMKKIIYLILLIVTFSSCKKEDVDPINEQFNSSGSNLISEGVFSSNSYTTSGAVKLYTQNNTKSIVFENFKTSNGPDLRVYLSTSTTNTSFVDLGKLKSTSGNFSYTLDSNINTSTYKFVLIWCEDFSVLFGNAPLK